MSLAMISGFAVLALAGGFGTAFVSKMIKKGVNMKKDNIDLNYGGSVGSDKNRYVYTPSVDSSDITSYPFSLFNPSYTGATYIGGDGDWFLMANGQYFSKKYKKWSKSNPNNNDDKKNNTVAPVVGGSVGGAVLDGVLSSIKGISKATWFVIIGVVGLGYTLYKNSKNGGKL